MRELFRRVWYLMNRRRMDAELQDEMAFHREMATREGRRSFGNVLRLREQSREAWGWTWLDRRMQDLRYAVRTLRLSSGFAVTVVVTLALGLGATAAMFTVVNRVLLRSMPYANARRVVEIQESGRLGAQTDGAPFLDIAEWRARSHSFEQIGFVDKGRMAFLEGDAGSEQVDFPKVSANLFATLGVHPALGRGFAEHEDGFAKTEAGATIVLSDVVWRDAFGGDAKILGKVVKINGDSYTVVGVMPRGFSFPMGNANPSVWAPVTLGDADKTRENHAPLYMVVGLLKRGVTLQDAEAELKVIQAGVAKEYTDMYTRDLVNSVKIQRYSDTLVGTDVRTALLALFAAAGVLWLIACVNVTGLMLARGTARQREIAVRGALGASRWRIVLQLLTEGLLLSVVASALGLGLAVVALKIFAHGLAAQLKIQAGVMPSGAVIGVLLGLTVLSAVVSSVWPALVAARASIESSMRQGGLQSGVGRRQHRMRGLLVVTQVALSMTLLVACGLMLRSIYVLRHVPLGFRTDHVIVGNMTIPGYEFAGRNMMTELYQPLVERVQHLPGVQSAALMTEVPLGHTFQMVFSFSMPGNSAAAVKRRDFRAQFRAVSPEMQKVFGFKMLKGRFFNEGDTPGSQAVVVVNRAFVKAFSENNDPDKMMGQQLMSLEKGKPAIVVGILDDERQVSVADQSQPEIEVSLRQITPNSFLYHSWAGMIGPMDLAVRTDRSPSSVVPELRELLQKASPELAHTKFTTMNQIVEDSYGNQQMAARLLVVFGGSALLLCVAGLYGLLAYTVTQRTRELGVRIALGAQRGHVMWMVMRQAGWMLLAGSAVGLGLAYFASRLLGSFLYGVKPHDAWTMVAVSVALICCGLGAAYLPARRAARVDPMEALRAE
jgi:predicted permease